MILIVVVLFDGHFDEIKEQKTRRITSFAPDWLSWTFIWLIQYYSTINLCQNTQFLILFSFYLLWTLHKQVYLIFFNSLGSSIIEHWALNLKMFKLSKHSSLVLLPVFVSEAFSVNTTTSQLSLITSWSWTALILQFFITVTYLKCISMKKK